MSDLLSFDVIGNKLILDNLNGLDLEVRVKAQEALASSIEVGKAYAESIAPVSDISTPGYVHMKEQYYTDVQEGVATLGNDSDHIVYVELGTHKMQAQPTLVPGAIVAGNDLKDRLEGMLLL